ATYTKFEQFVEDKNHKVHDMSSDQLTVALCNAANAPVATDAVLADLTVVAYTNLSSRDITTSTSTQTSGTYKLTLTDLVLTASGGAVAAFRYVVIYNEDSASPDDALISYYDYGSDLTLADTETLTIDFDGSAGFYTDA
ncbi:unnamed protein product, partial [marine sediment metagenome]